ncbi:ATP-binding protein [Polaromonas sp. CG_9.11]|uniref:PAS domain-containing hybrid sensor histidine kinase/response regulator n=1 Tax=Polaromonas sp. CG_9.11 TaxID=2787730 RepID=UPI0018C95904|nr:ATP-binding protein [Polaromonas sp. CG_9.11]MBG6077059.1 PAS domain S-box-containing protein [Polaromonas sp. CG_9.11]
MPLNIAPQPQRPASLIASMSRLATDHSWGSRRYSSYFLVDETISAAHIASEPLDDFSRLFRTVPVRQQPAGQIQAEGSTPDDSRALLSLLLASSLEGIYGINAAGCCTFMNAAGAALLGYEASELVGQPLSKLIHHRPADASGFWPARDQTTAVPPEKMAGPLSEDTFWRKNGTPVPVACSMSPLTANGKPAGGVVRFSDLTESRCQQAERQRLLDELQVAHDGLQALRSCKERYRSLFESMDQAFCVIEMRFDPAGAPIDYWFVEMNAMFEQQTGIAGVQRKTARMLFPEHDNFWANACGRVVLTGKPVRFDHEVKSVNRWFEVYASPFGSPGSLKVAVLFRDITSRRQSDTALRQLATELAEADRCKTEFMATLAHELRHPLAPIRSGLGLLRLGGSSPEGKEKVLDMMDRQVSQMTHLIDDLMDVARINGGQVKLRKQRVALKSIVSCAIETSLPLMEAGRHALIVQMPDACVEIEADPARMTQVVVNLLNNAAKYTPVGGRIEITAHQEGNEAVLWVSDNGVGMAEASLATMFELYQQVEQNLNGAQGGLGIGLALVRRLVELHGGTVEGVSDGLGQGSTFTVRLPLASNALKALSDELHMPQPSLPDQAPARALRILVVDDHADAATTLAALLEIQGHTTQVAHDGQQALKTAGKFKPDVVFLDIDMPGMNGYETAQALRKMEGLTQTVLVALTGWNGSKEKARSQTAGFDHHLAKPAALTTLNALVSTIAASLK